MNLLLVTSLLVFAAVTAAAYALSVRLEADRNPVSLRLRHLRALHSSEAGVSFGERPPALLRLVALLGGFLPARDSRDALRIAAMTAADDARPPAAPGQFLDKMNYKRRLAAAASGDIADHHHGHRQLHG